jgi:hypothetical protein
MRDATDALLGDVVALPQSAWQTVPLDVMRVKRVVFHFEGGDPTFYGDGRTHAWYFLDNLVYDPSCVTDGDCADPTPVCTPSGACGVCSATVVCPSADACNPAVCDVNSGQCSTTRAGDGSSCDDGRPCTQSDACQAGVCVGAPVVCAALDSCHDVGTCDTTTGICSNPAKLDGFPCAGGVCALGTCVPEGNGGASGSGGTGGIAGASSAGAGGSLAGAGGTVVAGGAAGGSVAGAGATTAGAGGAVVGGGAAGAGGSRSSGAGTGGTTATGGTSSSGVSGQGGESGTASAAGTASGCGCRQAGSREMTPWATLLVGLIGALSRRRTSRRRPRRGRSDSHGAR